MVKSVSSRRTLVVLVYSMLIVDGISPTGAMPISNPYHRTIDDDRNSTTGENSDFEQDVG